MAGLDTEVGSANEKPWLPRDAIGQERGFIAPYPQIVAFRPASTFYWRRKLDYTGCCR
jgi:hypothetical protein